MRLTQYQVDAFARQTFEGNPAAVCPLDQWIDDHLMQSIAAENNLAETAFFVNEGSQYQIRWFTPTEEVDLCGHATLASAHVLFKELAYLGEVITFSSRSGALVVRNDGDLLSMDFPNEAPRPCDAPVSIAEALGLAEQQEQIASCYLGGDLIVELTSEQAVLDAKPNLPMIEALDARGLIITAQSQQYDFVNRCFFPKLGIAEDPVTGSAFTQLVPMWAERLNKQQFIAKQVSTRGGEVFCSLNGDRVGISGHSVLFMKAEIFI